MITEPLVARVLGTFDENSISAVINPIKPTMPAGKGENRLGIDIFAGVRIDCSLYDTDWTNWDYTSYNYEFEMSAGYHPNALMDGVPPALNPEDLPKLYQKFVDHFCNTLSSKLGKSMIEKVNKKPADHQSFYFEDTGHYLETSHYYEANHAFKFLADFSKVARSESGSRRVKLGHTGKNVHKTGDKGTMDELLKRMRLTFDQAYQIIVETRFNECLQGK